MVDKKQSYEEWLNEAEWPSAEESACSQAERKAAEGKWFQTVTMQEDGSLFIVNIQYFNGGGVGEGSSESKPGDLDYDELLGAHGKLELGKAHTLVRRMIDGKWCVLPESDEVKPIHKSRSA